MGSIGVCLGLIVGVTAVLAGVTAQLSAFAWATVLLPWLLWCVWAGLQWRSAPSGWLHWHAPSRARPGAPAGQWQWHADRTDAGIDIGSVEPVLDMQRAWLVRLDGSTGAPRWVCVDAGADPPGWLAIRRALMAAARRVP